MGVLDDTHDRRLRPVEGDGVTQPDVHGPRHLVGQRHFTPARRVATVPQPQHGCAQRAGGVLGPELEGLGRPRHRDAALADHIDRGEPLPRAREIGVDRPALGLGHVEHQPLVGGAEDGIAPRRHVVGRGDSPYCDRDREAEQCHHQELLAPLTPEQPQRPADHGPSGGGTTGQRPGQRGPPGASSDSGPASGSVWSTTRPSRKNTMRSAHEASCASCVTTTPRDAALARGAQQAHHRLTVDRVERASRLVGEQEEAVADDGAGDGDPLALATGQVVGEALRLVGNAQPLQRLDARDAGRAGGDAVELEGQRHVLDGGQPGRRLKSWNT